MKGRVAFLVINYVQTMIDVVVKQLLLFFAVINNLLRYDMFWVNNNK